MLILWIAIGLRTQSYRARGGSGDAAENGALQFIGLYGTDHEGSSAASGIQAIRAS
jgi:hypothetical protein